MYLETQDLAIPQFGIAPVVRKTGYRHLKGIEVSAVREQSRSRPLGVHGAASCSATRRKYK